MIKFLIGLLFVSQTVFAEAPTKDVDRQYRTPWDMKLVNPGFENNKQGWTNSGGTFSTTITAANVGDGVLAASFQSTATDQYVQQLVTIPNGLYGKNGIVRCWMKSSNTDFILQAHDGTNVLGSTTASSISSGAMVSASFIFPSSGSAGIRVKSASAGTVYIDQCYIGENTFISQVSQAKIIATAKFGTDCGGGGAWSASTTSGLTAFANDASCTTTFTGIGSVLGATRPGITLTNAPPGDYKVTYIGSMYKGTGDYQCQWAFWDGSADSNGIESSYTTGYATGSNLVGRFSYTTAGTRTFEVRAQPNSAGSCNLYPPYGSETKEIIVEYFPTSTQQIVTNGGDPTFTDWQSYTPTFSAGFGTATGINFWWKRMGDTMYIRGSWTTGTVAASTATITIPSGYTFDSTKIITSSAASLVGSAAQDISTTTGVYNGTAVLIPSGATNTLGFSNWATGGSSQNLTPENGSAIFNSSSKASLFASFPISGWTSAIPTVAMVGGVSSSSSGQVTINHARMDAAGNFTRTSGSWISVNTHPSAGTWTFTISGFSATPVCFAQPEAGNRTDSISVTSATAVSLGQIIQSTTASEDHAVNITCLGPK